MRHPITPLSVRLWRRVLVVPWSGCWEFQGSRNPKGYGHISAGPGTRRVIHAQRAAWLLTHFFIPEGMCVCHLCDNPPCVNPEHLFLGTNDDNMADKVAKGRTRTIPMHGVSNGSAKLNDAAVVAIRRGYSAGRTQEELAAEFGVTQTNVGHVVRGKTWRHVSMEGL